MRSESHGTVRERQVRDIAARLGVADFVYFASPVTKGAGSREASGDGLLMVGESGAILQVKAREPSAARADTVTRATAWIQKNAHKAREQGLGTKRELNRRRALGEPLVVLPVRAAVLPAGTKEKYSCTVRADVGSWPIVVIVDHQHAPATDLGFCPDTVWFTFDDWTELQRRLRSTSATLEYVRRVLRGGVHVPLGMEVQRYTALQRADVTSAATSGTAVPFLVDPEAFDVLGADIYHSVIDKIWPDDGPLPWKTPDEYREMVEFLDSVPPSVQAHIGRWFLRKRTEIEDGRRVASGLTRLEKRDRIVFACTPAARWREMEDWYGEFTCLTALRHFQALESGAPDTTATFGVGAWVEERSGKAGVAYSFVMLRGRPSDLALPMDLRRLFEWRYGVHSHEFGHTVELLVGPEEPCPCMSGDQYRGCCG